MTTRGQRLTRRGYLALTAAAGASLVAGRSRAASTDYSWEDGGDNITRRFDEDELRAYLPRFDISRAAREQLIGIYGWIAESPDHDTDAYYYWLRYSHQNPGAEDLPFLDRVFGVFASDSHLWDHEPAIIFVRSNGAVDQAVVTGYHHFPLAIPGHRAPLTADENDRRTHLELEVIDPWHHYTLNHDEDGANIMNNSSISSFLDVRDQWISRGVFDESSRLAVDNPWTIKDGRVNSWWADGSRDAWAAKLWYRLGLRGAVHTDPEVRTP